MTTTLTATGITFNDATSQTTTGVEIPAGTLMLFQQTAAPTGWTKQTTHNDKALRVVSGTASSGGTSAFTTVFTNQTPTINTSGLSAAATTLTTAQLASHSHGITKRGGTGTGSTQGLEDTTYRTNFEYSGGTAINTIAAGSGNSHTHSISGSVSSSAINLAVQYVDLIIASKD